MKLKVNKYHLPDKESIPSEDLGNYTWLIYGERKIGKTTLAAQFEKPYALMTEPGAKHIGMKQSFCATWEDALGFLSELEKHPDYCKTLIIDTGYMLYERCFVYCIDKMGIDKPQDESWGSGWKFIDREFREFHDRISAIGIGLIVLAHSEVKEIKMKGGFTYNKLTTQLGGQAYRYYAGVLDIIAYYHFDENKKRFLCIRGSADVDAGARVKKHFFFPSGKRVEEIPMGNGEDEAYENLLLAFNNKLPEKGGITEKKKIVIRKR